jgi:hypothetical protein
MPLLMVVAYGRREKMYFIHPIGGLTTQTMIVTLDIHVPSMA